METSVALKSKPSRTLELSDSDNSDLSGDLNAVVAHYLTHFGDSDQFKGWNDIKKRSLKLQTYLELIENFDLPDNAELDIIDGIRFVSFICNQDLINYTKQQERMNPFASQSDDDGLEIMDDSSYSEISSSRVIIPTKTTDVKKIKGWRKKRFISDIVSCSSSDRSVKYNDAGFSEDRNSDVASECQASNVSHGDQEQEELQLETDIPLETCEGGNDDLERSNLSCKPTDESPPRKSLEDHTGSIAKQTSVSCHSYTRAKSINDNQQEDSKPNLPLSEAFRVPSPISQNTKREFENLTCNLSSTVTSVYQSRVRRNFLSDLEKKLSKGTNVDNNIGNNTPSSSCKLTNEISPTLSWHVPNKSLLTGSIFDVKEASNTCDETNKPFSRRLSLSKLGSDITDLCETISPSKNAPGTSKTRDGSISDENTSDKTEAFQSSILDTLTEKPSELLIEFELPKLDAAKSVTHKNEDENILAAQKAQTLTPPKVDKPLNTIKAKTLAEKRKILENMNKKNKRLHKLPPLKYRDTEENVKLSTRLSKNDDSETKTQKKIISKIKPTKKKVQVKYDCFDENGAFTYGREKPLSSRFPSSLLPTPKLDNNEDGLKNDCGMILNVGLNRPLFKESFENITSLLNNDGTISEHFARFAVAAVQPEVHSAVIVTRILVPVLTENLRNIMHILKPPQVKTESNQFLNRDTATEFCLFEYKNESVIPEHLKSSAGSLEMKQSICNAVDDMINYVEKKDYFDSMRIDYDPDAPVPTEKEEQLEESTPVSMQEKKKKKTRLQRQIEHLGGTFISMEEEEQSSVQVNKDNCTNEHCQKGCVCTFLKSNSNLHCGKASCIFQCSCSSAQNQALLIKNRLSLLPQAKHLQKNLAPVEREFHQTVIMSKHNQTITVESKYKKRQRKVPSKYKDENFLDAAKCEEAINQIVSNRKKLTPPKIVPEKSRSSCNDGGVGQNHAKKHSSETISNSKTKRTPKVDNTSIKETAEVEEAADSSHLVDTNDCCSRTKGVPFDYLERNFRLKLRLKSMMLYARLDCDTELQDEQNSIDISNENDSNMSMCFKDDLDNGLNDYVESENDLNNLQSSVQEDDSGLAIDFVCSLPPENFENIESVARLEKSSQISKEMQKSNEPIREVKSLVPKDVTKNKTERVVYATLPSTETDCKWWVVELNNDLFTHLVFTSDKRCLSVEIINKLIYNAETTQKTIRCPLRKPFGSFKDIFGAYAVLGHQHLVFFGPFDISEGHGITAVKKVGGENFTLVPFTTNFGSSVGFESLGIKKSGNSEIGSEHHARAVWWYSKKSESIGPGKEEMASGSKDTSSSHQPACSTPDTSEAKETLCPEQVSDDSPPDLINASDNTEQEDITHKSSSPEPENNNKPDASTENSQDSLDDKEDENNYDPLELDKFNLSFNKSLQDIQEKSDPSFKEKKEDSPPPENKIVQRKRKLKRKLTFGRKKSRIQTVEKSICKPAILRGRNPLTPQQQEGISVPSKSGQFTQEMIKPIRTLKHHQNLEELSSLLKSGKSLSKKVEEIKLNRRKRNMNLPDLIPEQKRPKIDLTKEDISDYSSSDDSNEDDFSDSFSVVETQEDAPAKKILVHTSTAPKTTALREVRSGALPSNLVMKTPNPSPCPEFAMICMTPGVGYIPVTYFSHLKIILEDPLNAEIEHSFETPDEASEWLKEEFKKRIRFKVKSDMSWRLVKGSLIKYLQPLNPAIFRLSSRHLEVTENGLETTLTEIRNLENDPVLLKRACDERLRRSILKEAFFNLKGEVFETKNQHEPKVRILDYAVIMIKVQKHLAVENGKILMGERRRQSELNDTLKKMISDIKDIEERQMAIKFCQQDKKLSIENNIKSTKSDKFSKLLAEMKTKEIQLVQEEKRRKRHGLGSTYEESPELERLSTESPLNTNDNSLDSSTASTSTGGNTEKSTSRRVARPSEGIMRKQTPARPNLRPRRPPGEVVDLVSDSDGDSSVIELSDSDDEEVSVIAEKNEDIEFISMNSSNNKSNSLKQTPQNRLLTQPVFAATWPEVNRTAEKSSDSDSDDITVERVPVEASPVAMLVPKEVAENHAKGISPDKSSRTVPVSSMYKQREKFLPLGATKRINLLSYPPTIMCAMKQVPKSNQHAANPGSTILSKGFASFSKSATQLEPSQSSDEVVPKHRQVQAAVSPGEIPSKTVTVSGASTSEAELILPDAPNPTQHIPVQPTPSGPRKVLPTTAQTVPIGRMMSSGARPMFKAKRVLVSKFGNGIKLSKLPLTRPPLPLSATPVTIMRKDESEETVTLYHPSEELSETRTVRFQPSAGSASSLHQAGPKIRTPREDCTSLKVMFPKRN